MTYLDKQEFQAWALGDLLANTTRGLLAEFIVAKALGIHETERVVWNQYDLKLGDIGVEVKSAAYVQAWKQAGPSVIAFDIAPKAGWDEDTGTFADSPRRSAAVYVFCLLHGKDERPDPLDVGQWSFYVLARSVLDQKVQSQRTIRLNPLIDLGPKQCTFEELGAVIRAEAGVDPGSTT